MHPHEKKRPILYSETKIKMHIDILSYIKQSQNIKEHDFGSVERKKKVLGRQNSIHSENGLQKWRWNGDFFWQMTAESIHHSQACAARNV